MTRQPLHRATKPDAGAGRPLSRYDELVAEFEAYRRDGAELGAMVPLDKIAARVLVALRSLMEEADDVVTIREAAMLSGYSADHLRRAIATGQIPNAGRRGKPAIRRSDVPKKPGHAAKPLPIAASGPHSPRRRIALEVSSPPERSA